jgi:hypothetical protein
VLPDTFGYWVESPRLRLRSQHGLELLHNGRTFSLEDAVEAKHSPRMLLADRVKPDLLQAVQASRPRGDTARAAELLATWDNTVAIDSRGAVLFETWWNRYRTLMAGRPLHATEWSADEPTTTPRGLADLVRAAEAFAWAVPETTRRFGAWDVAWGDVHRVRRGDVDVPVAGCAGALGCFRVLTFSPADDGARIVDGGDGWVLAVEFGPVPRAYSVLAYGQSNDPASPPPRGPGRALRRRPDEARPVDRGVHRGRNTSPLPSRRGAARREVGRARGGHAAGEGRGGAGAPPQRLRTDLHERGPPQRPRPDLHGRSPESISRSAIPDGQAAVDPRPAIPDGRAAPARRPGSVHGLGVPACPYLCRIRHGRRCSQHFRHAQPVDGYLRMPHRDSSAPHIRRLRLFACCRIMMDLDDVEGHVVAVNRVADPRSDTSTSNVIFRASITASVFRVDPVLPC